MYRRMNLALKPFKSFCHLRAPCDGLAGSITDFTISGDMHLQMVVCFFIFMLVFQGVLYPFGIVKQVYPKHFFCSDMFGTFFWTQTTRVFFKGDFLGKMFTIIRNISTVRMWHVYTIQY